MDSPGFPRVAESRHRQPPAFQRVRPSNWPRLSFSEHDRHFSHMNPTAQDALRSPPEVPPHSIPVSIRRTLEHFLGTKLLTHCGLGLSPHLMHNDPPGPGSVPTCIPVGIHVMMELHPSIRPRFACMGGLRTIQWGPRLSRTRGPPGPHRLKVGQRYGHTAALS